MECPNCGHPLNCWTGHKGSTPTRIVSAVEANKPVTFKELGSLVDAKPETLQRAYYRLLEAGAIRVDAGLIYLETT